MHAGCDVAIVITKSLYFELLAPSLYPVLSVARPVASVGIHLAQPELRELGISV